MKDMRGRPGTGDTQKSHQGNQSMQRKSRKIQNTEKDEQN